MKFSPKCFKQDHVARTEDGRPLGRLVMRDNDYEIGKDLNIGIFKIPVQFNISPRGLRLFVDESEYEIPGDILDSKIKNRGVDIIVSNFVLKVVE